jgi:hypothetical protein
VKSFLKEQPQYSEAGSLSGTTAAKVFSTAAGSPERAKALVDARVSPELQRMMVAAPPVSGDLPNAATTEPRKVAVPGQAGQVSVEFSDSFEKDVKKKDGCVTVAINAETAVSTSGTVEFKKAKVGRGQRPGRARACHTK